MGTLLLLLGVGGALAAAVWAAVGRKGEESPPPFYSLREGEGPRSSPPLPGKQEDGIPAPRDRGKPVVLGEGDTEEKLKEALRRASEQAGERPGEEHKAPEKKRPRTPPKVTYPADEIIARSSPHAHHRRGLFNAENLLEKMKAEEAREIYERTRNRVDDEEIREKLDQNIEDINRWLSGIDEEEEEESFGLPGIILPLTSQIVALENLAEGLKNISQGVAEQLQQISPVPVPPGQAPVVQPIIAPGPVTATGPITAAPQAFQAPAAAPQTAAPQALQQPPLQVPPQVPPQAVPPDVYKIVAPSPEPDVGLAVPGSGLDLMSWNQGELEELPPGITLNEKGELVTDGWTDADFDQEWEKFKNLPLEDRRSGIERRVQPDRRTDKRKDRRSGLDRRKKDLFKEREEFLKKLEKHKARKKLLEEHRNKKLIAEPVQPIPPKQPLPPEPLIAVERARIEIAEIEQPLPEPLAKPEPEPEPEPPPLPEAEEETRPLAVLEPERPELDQLNFPEADERYLEPELPPLEEEPEGKRRKRRSRRRCPRSAKASKKSTNCRKSASRRKTSPPPRRSGASWNSNRPTKTTRPF